MHNLVVEIGKQLKWAMANGQNKLVCMVCQASMDTPCISISNSLHFYQGPRSYLKTFISCQKHSGKWPSTTHFMWHLCTGLRFIKTHDCLGWNFVLEYICMIHCVNLGTLFVTSSFKLQYDPTLTATYGVWNFWLLKWGGCLGEAARLY